MKIKNLRFKNGTLDENFIYETITNKTNIFHQLSILKLALKPYKQLLNDNIPNPDKSLPQYILNGTNIDIIPFTKSKHYYENLVSKVDNYEHKCTKRWTENFNLTTDEFNYVWQKNSQH